MTNAEKYLKKGVTPQQLIKAIGDYKTQKLPFDIFDKMEEFFKASTITLTEDERVILRHIDKQFFYIQRIWGELQLTNKERTWCDYDLFVDDDVFQFIKEGEEYSIEELLKGE